MSYKTIVKTKTKTKFKHVFTEDDIIVVLQIHWKEDSSENRSALLDNKNIKVEFPVYDVNDLICLNRVPR